MDPMVLMTQEWLNATYGGYTGRYNIIPENGKTGWTTIYGLTRALQIELGIQSTADNFGPTTQSLFSNKYPNGVKQQTEGDQYQDNIYAIIQGALWCKGYPAEYGGITKHFYQNTGNSIIELKTDAGMNTPNSNVTLNVMIALLSMNQYVKVYGGTDDIRTIQQNINRKYESYVGLAPCDGVYGRDMNEALIKVLQAIEGYSVSGATGNFGDGTKANLPILPDVQNSDAVALVRYSLCCNGYSVDITSTTWNSELESVIRNFQTDLMLPVTGKADVNTWMSLLLSKGNPDRPADACDTRFEITSDKALILKNSGYYTVGRYLTGGDFKELRINEPQTILDNGLNFFPIFQESDTDITYFTTDRALQDAKNSVKAARKYGIPGDNIIYYAVDTDPQDTDITNYILPYFKTLSENMHSSYKVGIYGTRNVCSQVMGQGYAVTAFVSDMSTGYSGNMGFKIPSNWNFDQFSEISIGDGSWAIDKDAFSCREAPVTYIYPRIIYYASNIKMLENYYVSYKYGANPTNYSSLEITKGVTNFLRSFKYGTAKWYLATLKPIDNKFIDYVQTQDINLYNTLKEYASSDSLAIADGFGGLIDIGHLAATTEGYIDDTIVPNFFFGWGGDLATLMSNVDEKHGETGEDYNQLANLLIANNGGGFGYPDICSDADAIKISNLVSTSSSKNPFSDSLNDYYLNYYQNRFSNYVSELGCLPDETQLTDKIKEFMSDSTVSAIIVAYLGSVPSSESINACCSAFAKYIMDNLPSA